MYIVIPTETLKRTLQRDLVKNQRDKFKRNAKNVRMIQKGRKGKTEELKIEATKDKK